MAGATLCTEARLGYAGSLPASVGGGGVGEGGSGRPLLEQAGEVEGALLGLGVVVQHVAHGAQHHRVREILLGVLVPAAPPRPLAHPRPDQ